MLAAELRDGFEAFDFALPLVVREADEWRRTQPLDVTALPPFRDMDVAQLQSPAGQGDQFISQDLQVPRCLATTVSTVR